MMTSPPLSGDEAQREERGAASFLRVPDAAATGCVTINLDQLARNWMGLADLVAPARCGAVVKANAYGLGADRVIPALVRAGCTVFFIATPQEGHQARRLA
jgi:alanine racemase